MTAIEDPIEYDIIVRMDTDHSWGFRRKDAEDNPIIPTAAKAEIRSVSNKELWKELTCEIDSEGWIFINLPNKEVNYEDWKTRTNGEWDLLVTYSNNQYRWVYGLAIVDSGVTRD